MLHLTSTKLEIHYMASFSYNGASQNNQFPKSCSMFSSIKMTARVIASHIFPPLSATEVFCGEQKTIMLLNRENKLGLCAEETTANSTCHTIIHHSVMCRL